jgi:hypothetical protein
MSLGKIRILLEKTFTSLTGSWLVNFCEPSETWQENGWSFGTA